MCDLDAGVVQHRQPLRQIVAGGLHHFHAAVDHSLDIARVVRRADGRQEGQVDAYRFAGHGLAATNLIGQIGQRALSQAGDDAEAAGIRDRRSHFRVADEMHAALDDGVFDAERVGDCGFHGVEIVASIEGCRRRCVRAGILTDSPAGCQRWSAVRVDSQAQGHASAKRH